MEITKEKVLDWLDYIDGRFYHKLRDIKSGRDAVFNRKYAGKLGEHLCGSVWKITINRKQYKVSDILDMFETGKFVVKTRDKPRFEALRFVQRNKKKPYRAYINIDGKQKHLGYHSSEVEANSEYVRARLSYVDDLYTKYKDTVDSRVWECVRDSRWW